MLRSVKLKSTKRKLNDGVRSPGRIQSIKSRTRLNSSPSKLKTDQSKLTRILLQSDNNSREYF